MDAEASTPDPAVVSDEALAAIGFDVESPALEMIQDAPTRIRLLSQFRNEHAESSRLVRESLTSDDDRVGRDLLHKLMGTTATVGLSDLHESVIDLQDNIRSDDELDPELLDRFTDELDRVIDALDTLGESH